MALRIPHTAFLTCHSESRKGAVRELAVRVSPGHGEVLELTYTVEGDLSRLRIPPVRSPMHADHLWEHTCFEAFINPTGKLQYYEFNFAPSGEWASYAFHSYRDRVATAIQAAVPTVAMRRAEDTLEVHALIHLDRLPDMPPSAPVRLALCAVVEDMDGALSYWALAHPRGKPDFHHADAFMLEFDPKGFVIAGAPTN